MKNQDAPEGQFLQELRAVAADADKLRDWLKQDNALPEEFPTREVSQMCEALTVLQAGTVRGAVDALDYARKRIPTWRRDFLPARSVSDEFPPPQGNGPPPPDRDGNLDRALKSLLASCVTAISFYENATQQTLPQPIQQEQPLTLRDSDSDLPKIDRAAQDVIVQADALKESAAKLTDAASRNDLIRAINDTRVKASLVQVEIRQKRPMLSLLSQAGRTLRQGARVLMNVAKNARELGGPTAQAAGELVEASIRGMLEVIEICAKAVDETVEKFKRLREAERAGRDNPPTNESPEEQALLGVLLGLPISDDTTASLEKLEIQLDDPVFRARIFDLAKARGLTAEVPTTLPEAGLQQLARLTALNSVRITGTVLKKFWPFADMENLQEADVDAAALVVVEYSLQYSDNPLKAWQEAAGRLKILQNQRDAPDPTLLGARYLDASLQGLVGDAEGALAKVQALLPVRERVQGAEHPSVLATRDLEAQLLSKTGDAEGALAKVQALLPVMERVSGANDPSVLATRWLAAKIGAEMGEVDAALAQWRAILPLFEAKLLPTHRYIVQTREMIEKYGGATKQEA